MKKVFAKAHDIDELALKAITVHRNDKSGGVYAKMRRHFGVEPSKNAIKRAYKVARLLNIETVPIDRFFKPDPVTGTVTGRMTSGQAPPIQQIRGYQPSMLIIDELDYP